jgi:DHA1 family bicyclomycin/chloramphenicol resistance-like MFS transporter
MGAVSLDTYLPALPQLAADLSATASQTQLTLTACMIGLALGQLVAGPISDWTGRRWPLLLGLLAYVAMSALCAFAGSIELLIGLRFGQGLAAAVSIVLSRAIVRDLFTGETLVRVFATVMIALGAGPIVAPILGAQILRITDWRGTFLALALSAVILAVVVAVALPETLPPTKRRAGRLRPLLHDLRVVATERVFFLSAATVALTGAAFFTYLASSSFVLQGIFDLSPQWFSAVFAVNAAGFVLGGQANRPLLQRQSNASRLLIGVLVSLFGGLCLLTALLLPAPPLALVLFGFVAVTGGYGFTSPNGSAIAMAPHGHRAGAASALFGVATYGLGGVVAPIGGIAGASLLPAAIMITCLTAAALVTAYILRRSKARTPEAATVTVVAT